MEISMEQIKEYNQKLKEYKDKKAKISAEIEYNSRELESLCKELSAELGMDVNPDNIEKIHNDFVQDIKKTLEYGNNIMREIAESEQQSVNADMINQQSVGMSEVNKQIPNQPIANTPLVNQPIPNQPMVNPQIPNPQINNPQITNPQSVLMGQAQGSMNEHSGDQVTNINMNGIQLQKLF